MLFFALNARKVVDRKMGQFLYIRYIKYMYFIYYWEDILSCVIAKSTQIK